MRKIDSDDIAILRVLDGLRRSYEYVPFTKVFKRLRIPHKEVSERLSFMNSFGYVRFTVIDELRESGAKITELGEDALSIWDFRKHEVISKIGTEVGVGKESVILSAESERSPSGFAALKFHRYFQKEFSAIKKSLSWSAVRIQAEKIGKETFDIDVPRAKAQIEFNALSALRDVIPVPKPYGINRHAVCMQLIGEKSVPAPLLAHVKVEEPADVLALILEDYEKAVEAGWVHGDLSEFNIMVDKGELYYIDWPQAVPSSYPDAVALKERDVASIRRYFKSKYGVSA